MSPGSAARWVLVCILLVGGSGAHAQPRAPAQGSEPRPEGAVEGATDKAPGDEAHQRRPVAVVNLADDVATRELASELDVALSGHPDLKTLPSTAAAALKDEFVDDDAPRLERAHRYLLAAQNERSDFKNAEGAQQALQGQAELLWVTPSLAIKPYAELAFELGAARILEGKGKEREGLAAFVHLHLLDPNRQIDGTLYVPEVVEAFKAGRSAVAGAGTIEIKGTGTAWIDGTEVGAAPGTFTAPAGTHVVWLTGIERETRGASITVDAGRPTLVDIPDAEASERRKLQRARLDLSRAPDAFTRATAMKHLAELTHVQDAVLLSMSGGRVIVQTWRGNAYGFSALRERGTDQVIDLLTPLAPPRVVKQPDPPKILPPLVTTHWYQRTSVRVGIGAGIVAAIVGGIVWANRSPGTFMFNPNITAPEVIGR